MSWLELFCRESHRYHEPPCLPRMGFVWLSVMQVSHQHDIRLPDNNQKRMVRPGAGATMYGL